MLFLNICACISCSDNYSSIHIDKNQKAIVSCVDKALKRVTIDDGDKTILYESFSEIKQTSIIYFEKLNPSFKITMSLKIKENYILNLKASAKYTITSYGLNGDRGPKILTFETDNQRNIINITNNGCVNY